MPIERMGSILKDAYANKYGVAAFNVFNYESIKWVLDVAQERNSPVIIQFYPAMSRYISFDAVAVLTKELARKTTIPVGLHLDHSPDFATAMAGIKAGFPSVMIDGSILPFTENVALTRRVVEIATLFDVEVEAELGLVGRAENKDDFMDSEKYTLPQEAVSFIEQTGVGSLAVSIGNSHGHYVCQPQLDMTRLCEINQAVDVPLVLHGGSGIPAAQVSESVCHGIAKVNIATELGVHFHKSLAGSMESPLAKKLAALGVMMDTEKPVKEFLHSKMDMLNPNGYSF